ncbi:lytic transglycosylase domain-containing protein [Castellaniella sp.]|uniref:lytic transglycosylase domain-containing protein n=1 Tax=Castellaniella sp. TaxID=1955812 RepID=UPI002AFE56C3|nr:lytic transglycosylase domain-containing protein [Castellaniella sp.]
MHAGYFHDRLQHGMRAVLHSLGEFIHVSAIYLGLAVLTTLVLSLVLPSMRQQSQQLHQVVLAMFQADGSSYGGNDAEYAWAPPDSQRPVSEDEAAEASEAVETEPAQAGAGETSASVAQPEFMQALAASMRDQAIPGVTAAQAQGLRSYLARKYRIAASVAGALVRTAFLVGKELKVEPQLILAVMAIESRYNPFVESAVGAQGLMQVMARVHRDKLLDHGGPAAIFNPVVNIRIGTQILSDCIRRRGSIEGGLACYVGASGPGDGGYGAKVLAERRRIALASGIPLGK